MKTQNEIVFLFDCDNTLFDNDRLRDDLQAHLDRKFGVWARDRYWKIFEELRAELGYADYLGALQRFRFEVSDDGRALHRMSAFFLDYPFSDHLFPNALDVLAYLQKSGPTVVLSDGDMVFQPHKIQYAGLWQAVDGRVLIYLHKEKMLADVERHYPAQHYVMVDDKLSILAAMKKIWGERLTTVFACQGHYALDPHNVATYPAADITIKHIGDLLEYDMPMLLAAAGKENAETRAS